MSSPCMHQLSPVTRGGGEGPSRCIVVLVHICWSLLDAPILSIVNPTRTPATLDLGKASDYFPKALILTIAIASCAVSFLLFLGLRRPVIYSYLPGCRFLFKARIISCNAWSGSSWTSRSETSTSESYNK